MKNLSQEERNQIAIEEFRKQPLQNICVISAIRMAETAISMGAKNGDISTECTIEGKRYKVDCNVTYQLID